MLLNLDPDERTEIEQDTISRYRAGEIGPIQALHYFRRAGLSAETIETALRLYRPKQFKPFAH